MASKRRLRKKSCEGKIRHETVHNAEMAITSLIRNRGHQGQLHVYQCSFCGKYHTGHRRHGNGIGSGYAGSQSPEKKRWVS